MAVRRYGRFIAVHADDSDLHVDVMRFFAIIAMCLFAILPHTEAPTATPENQPRRHATKAESADLSASNALAVTATMQRETGLSQSAPALNTEKSNTSKDHDTRRALSPIKHAGMKETPLQPVSTAASTTPLKSNNVAPRESASKEGEGVRFLNSDAFALAVASGAVTLVYHNQNESLVFDPTVLRFTRLEDTSLQIFGLAASEVPVRFHTALPKIQRADMIDAQWFITLPESTLAYLLDTQRNGRQGAVLNDRAQPI